jgi:putative intracellular protease/amidase
MRNGACAAFLFDGFADHQLALAMADLNRSGDFTLETFSTKGRPVTAASGLRVLPHASLATMSPADFDILLLPGGDKWEKGDNLEIFSLIMAVVGRQPLIALGSAVLALADLGMLDDLPHTGPYPGYFKRFCPDYAGESFFIPEAVVSARGVITVREETTEGCVGGILGLFDLETLEAAVRRTDISPLQEMH